MRTVQLDAERGTIVYKACFYDAECTIGVFQYGNRIVFHLLAGDVPVVGAYAFRYTQEQPC